VRKLRRSNLSTDAYTFVRDLFINGSRYAPGEKISVEELSRELGVSRTPLWGAINRLEAEGIVEVVPRQGVYLIKYDPERAVEIYEAREALEGMAARAAATKINERQLAALKANIDDQRALLNKGDVDGYYGVALDFHEQILRIAQLYADAPAAVLRRPREDSRRAAPARRRSRRARSAQPHPRPHRGNPPQCAVPGDGGSAQDIRAGVITRP
jgi:DNA-binding GntR family transcriptional regulator